ncbi:MAG: ElyC/SanA/YdcF family protein [Chthoniobacterales bacterium]
MSSWFRRLRLIKRRAIWCPTSLGSCCVALLLAIPVAWWCSCGESFLSLSQPLPAEVLVVEGWIGREGVRAAAEEFEQRGYQYVVATGGTTSVRGWEEPGWSYAEGTGRELIRLGVPRDRIVVVAAKDTETQRTYESAAAVWQAFQTRGGQPKAVNVFTLGPHARRSRLVFAKMEGPGTKVGVIAWTPSGDAAVPWWRSSDRAKELLTETAGYVYEALLNSGRGFNSPREGASP